MEKEITSRGDEQTVYISRFDKGKDNQCGLPQEEQEKGECQYKDNKYKDEYKQVNDNKETTEPKLPDVQKITSKRGHNELQNGDNAKHPTTSDKSTDDHERNKIGDNEEGKTNYSCLRTRQ